MRAFALILVTAFAAWPQTRPVTAEDTLTLWNLGEIAASSNSPAVLYSVSQTIPKENRATREWRQIGANGAAAGLPPGASSLRWSPDGKRLAYFASGALWALDWDTKKETRICAVYFSNSYLAHAGNSLAWSPDAQSLAFAGTLEPDVSRADPLVVSRVQYKTRTSYSDNRRTHIYVVPAAGGTPKLLTPGDHDEHSLDWSAGAEIVFLSNHEPDPDSRLNYDIYAVNPQSGAIRQLTRTAGVEMPPKISADGQWLAYTATTRAITTIDSVAEDDHLWLLPMKGGSARELNPKLDRRVSGFIWSDGEVIYGAGDHGKSLLLRGTRVLLDKPAQAGVPVEHKGRLYFAYSDAAHSREIWSLKNGELRQETHLNDAIVSQWSLSKPERIAFKSFDGTEIEGWLYPPVNGASQWPLILQVHGGPHGMFGYAFNASVHYAAARGYATLMVNPRGSSGYGQKFSDGCVNNWGGGDYKDLMAAVDFVLKTHTQADARNLFVTGGSYGGFMTNWIVTQTTRFRAAVAAASVSNLISFYATSLYQDLVHAEFGGYPWDGTNFEKLWIWSPLKYVKNVKTPLLLLHGEQDNDVHITQAEEMYTALRQRGVEAVLVRYPREGHGFREPKHVLDSTIRRVDWFDQHLVK